MMRVSEKSFLEYFAQGSSADPEESSLYNRVNCEKRNVEIRVQQEQKQGQELTFITLADSHSARSKGSAGKAGSGYRRMSDFYCPV